MDTSIKHFKQISIAASYLFLILNLSAHANDPYPAPKIPRGNGLLLLDIHIDAPSAAMTLRGIRGKSFEIKLIPSHGRWLIQSLPKGEYQISNIKVPYFDLPYVKHTEKNQKWRINIKAGQLNYAGRIEVQNGRTTNFVDIKKLNRLITDLPSIQEELAEIMSNYPLVDASYLRDDFSHEALKVEIDHD